jgi:hypothetical protein
MTTPSITSTPCQPNLPLARLPSVSELGSRVAGRRSNPPSAPMTGNPSQSRHPSDLARRLAKAYRSIKARKINHSEIDISVRKLVEQWLAAQATVAAAASKMVLEIPGVQLEPEFNDALVSLRTDRVAVYATKAMLFADTEVLAEAIKDYASALRKPYDNHCRLWTALARKSTACNPAEPAARSEVLLARRELFLAKDEVSHSAMAACEQHIDRARAEMVAARVRLEDAYHITKASSIELSPLGPLAEEGGGERQSDSNRVQLRPRSRPMH